MSPALDAVSVMREWLTGPFPRPGYFFITGPHRSGTSWLTDMLNEHPEIVALWEACFFTGEHSMEHWVDLDLVADWASGGNARRAWTHGVSRRQARLIAQRAVVEAFLLRHWEPGVRLIADKTPAQYLLRAGLLHTLFPESSLIVTRRDPRDTAVSLAFHRMKLDNPEGFESREDFERWRSYFLEGVGDRQPLLRPHLIEHAASEAWACHVRSREARVFFGERLLEVEFADLRDDPSGVVGRVLAWLGASRDGETVAACVSSMTARSRSEREPWKPPKEAHRQDREPTDWRAWFGEEDKALMKASAAGPLLIERGYEQSDDW